MGYALPFINITGKISGADTHHIRAVDWAEAQYCLKKANLGSEDAVLIFASFSKEGTGLFYNGTGHHILPSFPTKIKDWDLTGLVTGVRGEILEWLPTMQTELETNIMEQTSDHNAQHVLLTLLTEAIAGTRELCHFIDEAIKRLQGTGMDEASRMKLVAHKLAYFWRNVTVACMLGRGDHGVPDNNTMVSKVLWASIQAMRKIWEYRSVQFA